MQKGDYVDEKECLDELFNFSVVMRGHVRDIEKIKEYIVENYVEKGLIKLTESTYEKKEIYTLTEEQWKEYQKLKKKDWILIGAGFP